MAPQPTALNRYDYAVYDAAGKLTAVVEAKRRFNTSTTWARSWRGGRVDTTVVLVTPDRIYAWRPAAPDSAPPDLERDARPWLGPYFHRLRIPFAEVAPHVFEQIVGLWLRDLAHGKLPGGGPELGDVFRPLQGGEVVEQDAA